MRIIRDSNRLVWSASDLKAAAECEFAWLRQIDAKLGRCAAVDEPDDPMLERAAALGDAHEARQLAAYRAEHADAVVEIERVSSASSALAAAVDETNAALADPAVRVVFQAAFSADDFVGFADFLVRDDAGAWRVQDTKLARTPRVTALMQLAAYVDRLDALGVPRADEVDLLLGDGTTSTHDVADLLPLFSARRDRLRALVADRAIGDPIPAIAWGDPRGDLDVRACGRCAECEAQVVERRDVLLVAGMRPQQRTRLRDAGIATIDALAAASEAPARMSEEAFAGLRSQARLQIASEGRAVPEWQVQNPHALGSMPRPDMGDIFFDFEGDPLHAEPGVDGRPAWGIDYLFGWVDIREQYSSIWAHDLAAEREALERFCEFVAQRRSASPRMHIYHYAPYEPVHLAAMAARHGVCEAEVDAMLRDELFVDLYPVVKHALRVGSRSYSIKKLEPLYMGDEVRTQSVQKGDDSIVRYVEARELIAGGRADAGQAILDDLADYNRYDCVSTRRLRDWLVERARETGAVPAAPDDALGQPYEPSLEAESLVRRAGDPDLAPSDAMALRLAAAAIDYYPREAKGFWQAHFERLREPASLWADAREVMLVDARASSIASEWSGGRRRLELRGDLAPGSRLTVGSRPFLLYAAPAPFANDASERWIHVPRPATVVEVFEGGALVEETAAGETWRELPVAMTPPSPPPAGRMQTAIREWSTSILRAATAVGETDGAFPIDPATDILRGLGAAHHSGRVVSTAIGSDAEAIVFSLLSVPTYLAVQGPPGTGKTYVGAHVIARLVNEHGWKVGVVAQSHAVVENMLDRVVRAGTPRELVGKSLRGGAEPTGREAFTVVRKQAIAGFQQSKLRGYVVGGTAWDFANETRVARRSLDLLVVDEAGQFSLAPMIAVSMAARRLLLLGDPRQLPQVSQAVHPAPVNTSALGWLMQDDPVLSPENGYFLAQSWRMHPAVSRPVSELSYAGRLRSRPGAELRSVAGVEPGLHPVPVRHRGNATDSPEEASAVVGIVRDVVGRAFVDIDIDDEQVATALDPRPLTQADVIVVAPYNAQQQLVERELARAGFPEVRVGTVDRFQGQEAAVAIMTLAASSGRDAPRGPDFLLLENRLNVGISRAKVAAYLVHSPALVDDLPMRAESVARLSAFSRLVARPAAQTVP
ncbi:TM0106 family RecB-like putative nuclease [Microbacterium indicum]|uniref:TM0106 family RecB-like putative nuclease n=1 Tax=Microbacterium indicum TaxID=358100 RepID=UPI00042015C7|nr:bifunctional RecB family nuclease/DEAD/DEAH box helicase [Microbacterium indicum]